MRTGCTATVIVLLVLVAVASGCGGDTDKARGYMNSGDTIVIAMSGRSEQFQKDIAGLFEGAFKGDGLDPAAFEKSAGDVRDQADRLMEDGKKARAEYRKIKDLEGVDDYVEYADVMIQSVDLNEQGLQQLEKFLSDSLAAVKASDFDAIGLANSIETFSKQASDVSAALEKLQEQAAKIKKEKKL